MEKGYRVKRRNQKRKIMRIVAALAAMILIATVSIVFGITRRDVTDKPDMLAGSASKDLVQALDAQMPDKDVSTASSLIEPEASPEPSSRIEAEVSPEQTLVASLEPVTATMPLYDDPAIRARWKSKRITKFSQNKVKMLPILDYAKNATDKVAITVDDCFQFDNVRKIMDLADEYGAKLTFFPIGYQIAKQPGLWQEILDRGHELENHSYHHVDINLLSDRGLFKTITMQERAMNEALGVNYKMKYFRPRGGSGRKEPRLSKVLGELGYQAIASWGLSGSQNVDKLLEKCNGGHVVLFHSTDKDLKKLRKVIPALKEKGLKMVTLNEMYGKPQNVITPLPSPKPSAPPVAP